MYIKRIKDGVCFVSSERPSPTNDRYIYFPIKSAETSLKLAIEDVECLVKEGVFEILAPKFHFLMEVETGTMYAYSSATTLGIQLYRTENGKLVYRFNQWEEFTEKLNSGKYTIIKQQMGVSKDKDGNIESPIRYNLERFFQLAKIDPSWIEFFIYSMEEDKHFETAMKALLKHPRILENYFQQFKVPINSVRTLILVDFQYNRLEDYPMTTSNIAGEYPYNKVVKNFHNTIVEFLCGDTDLIDRDADGLYLTESGAMIHTIRPNMSYIAKHRELRKTLNLVSWDDFARDLIEYILAIEPETPVTLFKSDLMKLPLPSVIDSLHNTVNKGLSIPINRIREKGNIVLNNTDFLTPLLEDIYQHTKSL